MIKFKKHPTHMVFHCSATPPSMDIDVEDLRHWHTVTDHKWHDVGYHFVITRDGRIQEGRPKIYQGAHCSAEGMNEKALGVCLIGGMSEHKDPDKRKPEANFTFSQYNSMYSLAGIYNLICSGHCDHDSYNKPFCPGFNVKELLGMVKQDG